MQATLNKNLSNLSDAIIEDNKNLILPELKQNSRISKEKQLSVYTDGYIERLSGAIEADFPTLLYYFENYKTKKELGKIILSFIKNNPSKSYNLDKYPLGFYNFFEKNSDDEFAKNLCLLEYKIAEVFQAPDSDALLPQHIVNISETQLENKKFQLRTAGSLVEFNYDVEKFLSDFRAEKPAEIIKAKNYFFICRNNNEVKRNKLDEVEYYILREIDKVAGFSEAINAFISNESYIANNLQIWLVRWLNEGFFNNH